MYMSGRVYITGDYILHCVNINIVCLETLTYIATNLIKAKIHLVLKQAIFDTAVSYNYCNIALNKEMIPLATTSTGRFWLDIPKLV